MRKCRKIFHLVFVLTLFVAENILVFMEERSHSSVAEASFSLRCYIALCFLIFLLICLISNDTVMEIYSINLGIIGCIVTELISVKILNSKYVLDAFITNNRCMLEYFLCSLIIGAVLSVYVILEGCIYYCEYYHISNIDTIIDNLENFNKFEIYVGDKQYIGIFEYSDVKITKNNNLTIVNGDTKVRIRNKDNLIRVYQNIDGAWRMNSSNFVWHVNFKER